MLARTHRRRTRRRTAQGRSRHRAAVRRTRAVKPVDELIRFVVGPDGVVPDLKRKLPGRGLWITAERAALKDAVTRNVFARGFKREVRVDAGTGRPDRAPADAVARSMRSPSPERPDWSRPASPRSRRRIAHDDHRGPDPRSRCRRRRRRQARRRAAAAATDAEPIAGHQGFHDGPIGFGIGPVKCGTCSPACRACK